MKTIKVTISKDGSSVNTEVEGVKGEACTDVTKKMLEALGTVEETGKTNEYYESDEVHNILGG